MLANWTVRQAKLLLLLARIPYTAAVGASTATYHVTFYLEKLRMIHRKLRPALRDLFYDLDFQSSSELW